MKKIITATTVLTMVSSTILTTLTNSNTTTINSFLTQKNKINLKNVPTGGVNDYKYYFAYHQLSLNHNITQELQNAMLEGLPAIASILKALPSAVAGTAILWAGVLLAQWYSWNVVSYDQGNGVVIGVFGIVPSWFTSVWSQ